MKNPIGLCVLVIASIAPIASAGGQGAVRVDFDPAVGWANLNTTASGRLIVEAHLDTALPNEEFDVTLRVRYEDGNTEIFDGVAVLRTNGQGKGSVQAQIDVHPPDGSTTLRRVAVRVRRAPNPLYLAVAWDLPLK